MSEATAGTGTTVSAWRSGFGSELGLTDEQAAELEAVIEKNHDTARPILGGVAIEQFDALRQQFRDDIREHLTEEQRTRFDRLAC